jgi:molybdopterin molybdotransferase
VLATIGRGRVRVGRRPRAAVLVTGDELIDVGRTPAGGQIRNSNGPTLLALVRAAGGEPRSLGVVGDDAEAIRERVREGLDADVLVISGGVSAGVFDLVEPVLEQLGVEKLFDRVAIKPGAPLVFGHRERTLVFGLPGNPVSAQVTFELFVRPVLRRMQGARVSTRPCLDVVLLSRLTNRSGRRAHLPARIRSQNGALVAEPLRSMGSADVVAHARANALIVLAAERTQAEAGERAAAIPLASFLERGDE